MRRTAPGRTEAGQTMVLTVGCFALVALLAVVVVDASAAFLQRQRLADLADGAALVAADQVDVERLYTEGVAEEVPLDRARAVRAVAAYLRDTGDAEAVRWQVHATGHTVTVRLSRRIELPLVPPGWSGATTVTAEASARLRVHP